MTSSAQNMSSDESGARGAGGSSDWNSDSPENESKRKRAQRKAMKIASLSLIPGLGQLFNKRLDKAIAFALVNCINIVLLSVFSSTRLPFLDAMDIYYSPWTYYLNVWQIGSAPFSVLLFLLAGYTGYAIYDAYQDAFKNAFVSPAVEWANCATTSATRSAARYAADETTSSLSSSSGLFEDPGPRSSEDATAEFSSESRNASKAAHDSNKHAKRSKFGWKQFYSRWKMPALTLSIATCFSYVTHLGVMMITCFLIMAKIFPLHPVTHEQTIQFVLMDLDAPADKEGPGQTAADRNKNADQSHLNEKIADVIKASRRSTESGSRIDDPKKDASNKETETIASKEIITPNAQESPQETRSEGASDQAKTASKQHSSEQKNLTASATHAAPETARKQASPVQPLVQKDQIEQVQPTPVQQWKAAVLTKATPSTAENASNISAVKTSQSNQTEQTLATARGGMAELADVTPLPPPAPTLARSADLAQRVESQLRVNQMPVIVQDFDLPEKASSNGAADPFSGTREFPIERAKAIAMRTSSISSNAVATSVMLNESGKPFERPLLKSSKPFISGRAYAGINEYPTASAPNMATVFTEEVSEKINGDTELANVLREYFDSVQKAKSFYSGAISAGRAEAELIFNKTGIPSSIQLKDPSSAASQSLKSILAGMLNAKLAPLPAKHNGQVSLKVSLVHMGKRSFINVGFEPKIKSGATQLQQNSTVVQKVPGVQSVNKSTGSAQGGGQSPAMLGFMDESLSADPAMQSFWADYSRTISHAVRDNPTALSKGSTIATFSVNRAGQAQKINTTDPQKSLSKEFSKLLTDLQNGPDKLPTVPQKYVGKVHLAVKVSTMEAKPFVSVEIQPHPIVPTEQSMKDFESETKLQAYLQDLKKLIYKSWNPPSKTGSKAAMVGFHIASNGVISQHKIVQSSGDPASDQAALDASLTVTEWVAPPAGTEEDLEISMVIQNCGTCGDAGTAAEKKRPLPDWMVGTPPIIYSGLY